MYSQPDFYHFSQDSIILANSIVSHFQFKKKVKVLDLCAGCGVVGLELYQKRSSFISHIDFVELQPEFYSHLIDNLNLFAFAVEKKKIFMMNLVDFDCRYDNKYDLIISNPPYYNEKKYRQSANSFRNKCRLNVDLNYDEYFEIIQRKLTSQGCAYFSFLLSDIDEISQFCPTERKISKIGEFASVGIFMMF